MIKSRLEKVIFLMKKLLKKVICDYYGRHWPDKSRAFFLHGLRYPCRLCSASLYAKPSDEVK